MTTEEVKTLVSSIISGENYGEAFSKAWNTVIANKLENLKQDVTSNFFNVVEGIGSGDRASSLSGGMFKSTRSYSSKLAAERADLRKPSVPSTKIYHTVPFAEKDKAKAEGMRFDGDKKKWYHTSQEASKKSSFAKLQESEDFELSEAVDPKVAHDILSKHNVLGKSFFDGNSDHHSEMVTLAKKYKIRTGSTGKSAARMMHDHLNRQASKLEKE